MNALCEFDSLWALNHDADNQLYAALRSRSGLSEKEITKIIKDSGAIYGSICQNFNR